MKKTNAIAIIGIAILIQVAAISGCNGIHVSSFDGSVSVAEKFLKEHLDDASSYESVKWGKLSDQGDGTFEVYHSYRAKNKFGALVLNEVIFDISSDGKEVLSVKDDDGWHETYPGAVDGYRQKYYQQSDFKDVQFNGTLTETVDGLDEAFPAKGTFTKNGSKISGTIIATEKNVTYEIDGKQSELGKFDCKLKNTANGQVNQVSAVIIYKGFEGKTYDGETNQISFKLSENQ